MEMKIAINAGKYFTRNYKIPLHVSIEFSRDLLLNSHGQQLLPQKIAEHVWQEIQPKNHDAYYSISKDRNLPKELAHLFIYFHPSVSKSTWYSGKAIMLPDLSCESISKIIAKKELKVPLYKTRADSLMLLLVEGFSTESLFDKIEVPDATQLRTSFDRVYLLRDMENIVIQLK